MLVSSVASLKNERINIFCACCVFLFKEVKVSLVYFYLLNDLLSWANTVIFLSFLVGEGGRNHLKWKLPVDAWWSVQYRLTWNVAKLCPLDNLFLCTEPESINADIVFVALQGEELFLGSSGVRIKDKIGDCDIPPTVYCCCVHVSCCLAWCTRGWSRGCRMWTHEQMKNKALLLSHWTSYVCLGKRRRRNTLL